jgi:hypothetical protein
MALPTPTTQHPKSPARRITVAFTTVVIHGDHRACSLQPLRNAATPRPLVGRIVCSGVALWRYRADLGFWMRAAWLRRAGMGDLSYLAVPAAGPGGSPAGGVLWGSPDGWFRCAFSDTRETQRGCAGCRYFLSLPYGHRRPVAVWLRCVAWTRRWPSSPLISAAGVSRRMQSWSGWLPLPGRLAAGGMRSPPRAMPGMARAGPRWCTARSGSPRPGGRAAVRRHPARGVQADRQRQGLLLPADLAVPGLRAAGHRPGRVRPAGPCRAWPCAGLCPAGPRPGR